LYISAVARQGNGNQQILDFLEKHLNEQGIIYAQSRASSFSISSIKRACCPISAVEYNSNTSLGNPSRPALPIS
jgi:superfamily II DNA helicase RecQ